MKPLLHSTGNFISLLPQTVMFAFLIFLCIVPSMARSVDANYHGNYSPTHSFEENKGQVTGVDANRVKYTYKQGNLTIFLLDHGLAYQFNRYHYPEEYTPQHNFEKGAAKSINESIYNDVRLETYRMDMLLVDAAPHPRISAEGQSDDYAHYYPSYATHVRGFQKITYHDVYPFIDWVISVKGDGLKYDFVIRPGGDPSHIRLRAQWAESLELGQDGSLVLINQMGQITEKPPVSFQNGKQIPTQFVLDREEISFDIPSFDPKEVLIVDPELIWATYYSGDGFDDAYACISDEWGAVYLSGHTSSNNYIANSGHQNTYGGSIDAFLVKFDHTGTRLWATYFGGKWKDSSFDCELDPEGNIYIAGVSEYNTDLAMNGHQTEHGGGNDAFLVKFNPLGELLWSTYFGGEKDDWGSACATDNQGNVYLAGMTKSLNSIFYLGFQDTVGIVDNAFLAKFNAQGKLLWSTYYGGPEEDRGYSCATDASGHVYLSGTTNSDREITQEGHQMDLGGGFDNFLVKFDANGDRIWATYYGGTGFEEGGTCTVDKEDNVYLTGQTRSENDIAYKGYSETYNGVQDAYLVKFDANGNRIWATYYGGENWDVGHQSQVDASNNIYLTGATYSTENIAHNGHQNMIAGKEDAFLVKFDEGGERLWATYYGGPNHDYSYSCFVDIFGSVYIAGLTYSDTNISLNGFQNEKGEYSAGFLAKFNTDCLPPAQPEGDATQNFCAGASVTDLNAIGETIKWYTTAEGGTPLLPETPLVNGNIYYASQIELDCESPTRFAVTTQIFDTNTELNITENTLTANQVGGIYQWVDCDLAFNPIVGAQDQSFTPAVSGNYAVVVQWEGCQDTSECVYLMTTGIDPVDFAQTRIFPNPATDVLRVTSTKETELEIFTMTGQRIVKLSEKPFHEVDLSAYPPGIYYLKANQSMYKFVKQ